ncbi:MAG: NAD-dependent epimerase/dehydratase family protein [Acidobacteria bacterium]|nr:NAD-dependent epimerase/dehydratase family protein [Acidobacteriota bacterium]MBV9148070.1 NAD-dependent epimerase/dehydratase family protein [Acidobacteriota bacterium]MBV9437041.1 NAD-dependent epimerase/dehydratase family protein [Acidobacteriota bacterium]
MASTKPSLLVTGVSGALGSRLLPLLEGFNVIGIDLQPPADTSTHFEFESVDLGQESSCDRMARILRETRAVGVVHLAFVVDPVRAGVLDRESMWRINVAGTARVLEAIAEANRMDGRVEKLVHLSSVAVYGPSLKRAARENDALRAHTLTYAVHKKQADAAVQSRAKDLGGCDVYLLRPHIFSGRSVQNYMINAVRGTAYGTGRLGRMFQRRGTRFPLVYPWGKEYLEHKLQFAHVDDVARLIVWILSRPKLSDPLLILNVAGRGDPLTVRQCAQIAGAQVRRLPGLSFCQGLIQTMWASGITSIPPDAFPYLVGSYWLDTTKLRTLLGNEYEDVIRYTSEAALADGVMELSTEPLPVSQPELQRSQNRS